MVYLPDRYQAFGAASNLAAAINSAVTFVNDRGYASVTFAVVLPGGSPTLAFEASYDGGATWIPATSNNLADDTNNDTTTAAGSFYTSILGATHFRVRVSVAGAGAAGTVTGRAVLQNDYATHPTLIGAIDSENRVRPALATTDGHLQTAIHDPVGAFGEIVQAPLTPRVQIDAVYGALTTDVETLTDGVSGTATTSGNLFTCTTGVTVGGYGVTRSRRLIRYRPGQGVRLRFTAMFPSTPVANSLVLAGAFNSEDGIFFGYSGTTFGILRRLAGAAAIMRLTVTVGTGGVETITITLNGVAFTVASAGVLSTTATAELIAERVGGYTGWTSTVSPTSNGATVTFIQGTPAVTAGAFTMTSTGTATGTFATVQAGAANDSTTGFIPQTSWNVDVMDGSGSITNPSGVLLDTTKLNVFEVVYPFLGAGGIRFYVMQPSDGFILVHQIQYPNTYTITSQKNPTFRLGWIAASLGSSSNLTVQGASAGGFIEGAPVAVRDPFSVANNNYAAGTSEYVALALRNRGEFGSRLNQREIVPANLFAANETSNRLIVVRVVLNPTLTGTVNWQYVNQSLSAVEYAIPTTIPITGGTTLATFVVATSDKLDFSNLELRLEPGDVLAIGIATVSSTATAAVCINWLER